MVELTPEQIRAYTQTDHINRMDEAINQYLDATRIAQDKFEQSMADARYVFRQFQSREAVYLTVANGIKDKSDAADAA